MVTFQSIVIQVVYRNTTFCTLVVLYALYQGLALNSDRHRVFSVNHGNFREHVFLLAALRCAS